MTTTNAGALRLAPPAPPSPWIEPDGRPADGDAAATELVPKMITRDVSISYGTSPAVRDVSLAIPAGKITALIGASGSGKSTLLRALNRMHDLTPSVSVSGEVLLDGEPLYGPEVDPVNVRRRVGMVFQRPNPFAMSIFDNVAYGLRYGSGRDKRRLAERVERALRSAALWEEVKDRLKAPGTSLSGGQQQRLCVARALAVEPEVLLMDEPTSALDPVATLRIEELMRQLVERLTLVVVTHNMQQAARVSDITAYLARDAQGAGVLVESGPTRQLFSNPRDPRTEAYVTGRIG